MKNHVIALSGLYQSKEWEKIGNYLKNMESGVLEAAAELTGNRAVDALFYQKRKLTEAGNVRWEYDVHIPKECSVGEFDLCILFGNILDNALEACGRMSDGESRFICMQAKPVKKCFFIEAKNSVDTAEKYADGHTKKEKPWEHGIGLLNHKPNTSCLPCRKTG